MPANSARLRNETCLSDFPAGTSSNAKDARRGSRQLVQRGGVAQIRSCSHANGGSRQETAYNAPRGHQAASQRTCGWGFQLFSFSGRPRASLRAIAGASSQCGDCVVRLPRWRFRGRGTSSANHHIGHSWAPDICAESITSKYQVLCSLTLAVRCRFHCRQRRRVSVPHEMADQTSVVADLRGQVAITHDTYDAGYAGH